MTSYLLSNFRTSLKDTYVLSKQGPLHYIFMKSLLLWYHLPNCRFVLFLVVTLTIQSLDVRLYPTRLKFYNLQCTRQTLLLLESDYNIDVESLDSVFRRRQRDTLRSLYIIWRSNFKEEYKSLKKNFSLTKGVRYEIFGEITLVRSRILQWHIT